VSDDRELVRLADQILADIKLDAHDAVVLRNRIVGALIYVRQEAGRAFLGSALTRGRGDD
jgi:hypothetical protein